MPGPGGKGRNGRNGCNRIATARGEPLGPAGAGCAARTLTLPQAALEVGVAAPLAVEVDAVPDEERPAQPRGDGAGPAHHHGARRPPTAPRRRRAPQAPWAGRAAEGDAATRFRRAPTRSLPPRVIGRRRRAPAPPHGACAAGGLRVRAGGRQQAELPASGSAPHPGFINTAPRPGLFLLPGSPLGSAFSQSLGPGAPRTGRCLLSHEGGAVHAAAAGGCGAASPALGAAGLAGRSPRRAALLHAALHTHLPPLQRRVVELQSQVHGVRVLWEQAHALASACSRLVTSRHAAATCS